MILPNLDAVSCQEV